MSIRFLIGYQRGLIAELYVCFAPKATFILD